MAEFIRNGEQRDVDVSQGRRRPEEVGGLAGYGTLNRAGHGVGDEDDRLDRISSTSFRATTMSPTANAMRRRGCRGCSCRSGGGAVGLLCSKKNTVAAEQTVHAATKTVHKRQKSSTREEVAFLTRSAGTTMA